MSPHLLGRCLAVALVAGGGLSLSAATLATASRPAESAPAPRAAAYRLDIVPGGQSTIAWNGSRTRAGLSFRLPASVGAPLSVGLQVRSARAGSFGYRVLVTVGADGRAQSTIARATRSGVKVLRTTPVAGAWVAGDVVRLEVRVGDRRGGVVVRTRVGADASTGSRWTTARDRGTGSGTAGPKVLAIGRLPAAAPGGVSVDIGPVDATYSAPVTPTTPVVTPEAPVTPSAPATPPDTTTTPAPTVPADVFGPVGSAMTPGDVAAMGWNGLQAPRAESISVLPAGTVLGADQPTGTIWRSTLRSGELYTDGRSRAELYGRRASPWSTPAARWPDPPGSERWFTFSVFVPASFPLATDGKWFDLTQWKGYRGGSPPIALEIKKNRWRLGGARSNDNLIVQDDIGSITRGAWTRFTVGLRYSTSAEDGWVEVYRNGRAVLPRTAVATMDVVDGAPDPVYLKQGIYRSGLWQVDQTLYFSPVIVASTAPVVP